MLGKKADGGFTAVVIILIVIVFLGWLVNMGQRECSSNKECKDNEYCGSDFACHDIPVIEKITTPTIIQRDYSSLKGPFTVLGLAAIITALILRFKRNKEEKQEKPAVYPTYYTQAPKPAINQEKAQKYISKDISKTQLILAAIAGGIAVIALLLLVVLLIL